MVTDSIEYLAIHLGKALKAQYVFVLSKIKVFIDISQCYSFEEMVKHCVPQFSYSFFDTSFFSGILMHLFTYSVTISR